ncbi:MAG TPA: hypothetical protein VH593_23220 [Ktedonobacteraceae bacterium]
MLKAAVVHLELPLPVPFCGPRLSGAFEHIIIGGLNGVAFDHHD